MTATSDLARATRTAANGALPEALANSGLPAAPVSGGVLRVLIVAADPLARAGIAALLGAATGGALVLQIVGQASDRDDARKMLDAFRPNVVLLGLGWDTDRLDGLAAYAGSGTPVLALLGSEPEPAPLAAIWAAGPRAVLGRTADAEQLAAALWALTLGLAVFDPQQMAAPVLGPGVSSLGVAQPPIEPLTQREMEVLAGMADGLSNKLIARSLGISEHTVKYHVNAILGKLDAQSRTEAVVRATRAGLLLL